MTTYNEIEVKITRINVKCESCGVEMYSTPRYIFKPEIGESFHFCVDCYNLIKNVFLPYNSGKFDYIRIIKFYQWCERNGIKPTIENISDVMQSYISQLTTNYFDDVEV
jgi:hypothetical protein